MSEPPEAPRLDAGEEERVRRLLAGAGPEPLPPDVASRLDETLAALVAERREHDGAASGERLTVRPGRTRRRWPMVLVAAAAVCLIALGAGDLVRSGGGGAATSSGQAASESRAGAAGGLADHASGTGTVVARGPLPRLHSATLRADVARAAGRHSAPRAAPAGPAAVRCTTPPHSPRERVLLVRLDGDPASLVLGPVIDGHRVARLYRCADPAAPLTSLTVPVR